MSEFTLTHDLHVHSTFSDDATSSLDENVRAAERVGLITLGLADHVRASTTWITERADQVAELQRLTSVRLLCGVEVKILNHAGDLDLPTDLAGVDYVLIADHRYPGEDGPLSPSQVRSQLAEGALSPVKVIACLVEATSNAMANTTAPPHHAVVAHPFSLLSKLGLDESMITDAHLRQLSAAARATGTRFEVNEKWGCPTHRIVTELLNHGVGLVAGSDAHRCADVGRYDQVRKLLNASLTVGDGADGA